MSLSWKMVAVIALLVGGAIGAWALGAEELALVVAGFAGGLVPKAGAIGSKSDADLRNSVGMLVLALLLAGCGGADVAAVAAASDQAEERLCLGIDDTQQQDACIACLRASTDALICEMDDAACAELGGE